ncbi:MAG: FeoB-associated Cys-rich membrane protein [Opitutae bacterium]|nr:FeoB-associated Cys-rich membrane protein [Opitutae bacterium]
MSARLQTYIALGLVLAALVWLVRHFLGAKKKPGCRGDCGCPADQFKEKLKR